MACDLLDAPIGTCADKTFRGYKQTGVIYNETEIASTTKGSGDALITDFTMVSGKKGYEVTITGAKPFEGTKSTGEQKKFGMLFNQEVLIHLKGLSPANSVVAQQLSKGSFRLLLPQEGTITSEKWVAIGWESPLRATNLEWSEEEGCWVITLNAPMAEMPIEFLWKTNLATTDALVAASIA